MAASIRISFFVFSLVLLMSSLPASFAIGDPKQLSSAASLHVIQSAEMLIKSFNLFPEESINMPSHDPSSLSDKKIVEKRFSFPGQLNVSCQPSVQELGQHAGYYRLAHTKAARMFYLFFESRFNKSDPVVIWLSGGPGCSSELALFFENGPFKITKNLSLVVNEYGWDKASNILYIDQPTGTGFSYTADESDLRHDEEGVSNDLYDFLQAFFTEHVDFAYNDFYITGESYAGHYIPALASRINKGNKAGEGIRVNLKGFAIGNGLTNPEIQYKALTDYASDMGLIQKADSKNIENKLLPKCLAETKRCATGGDHDDCVLAFTLCNDFFRAILNVNGTGVNYYDIRKKCQEDVCYDLSNIETFLNETEVKEALGVGEIAYVSCSATVYKAMIADWMKNLEVGIPALLEDGIRVLIYAGEYDLICNWLGNSRWVHAMEWSGQEGFGSSSEVAFVVDGEEAGVLKSHGPLTFLKVYNAGHMVPTDQPKAALQMLRSWMQGDLTMA